MKYTTDTDFSTGIGLS